MVPLVAHTLAISIDDTPEDKRQLPAWRPASGLIRWPALFSSTHIRLTNEELVMSIWNQPRDAAVFGINIGKTVFYIVGPDAAHRPIHKATYRRETLLQIVERTSPVLLALEACPGSQRLARNLQAMGY
jgi:hypothetical protein